MSINEYEKMGYIIDMSERLFDISRGRYDKSRPIAEADYDDLVALSEASSSINAAIRTAAPHFSDVMIPQREAKLLKDAYCEIGFTERGDLRLKTPPLMKRGHRKSLQFYFLIQDALSAFRMTGNTIPVHNSFIIIYKRLAKTIGSHILCDNDNLEAQKCTNAITESMMKSDNPRMASFFYTTVQSKEDVPRDLMEITILPSESLGAYLGYISSGKEAILLNKDLRPP